MKPTDQTVYPLISSQKMVEYMWTYSVHMQATQIPCAVLFGEAPDFRLLARALNTEIARNDCLRLRFFREKGEIKQYFLPEYRLERVAVRTFAAPAEMEAYLNADAGRKLNVFKDETFRILFFTAPDGRRGIYLNVSHMVMDAAAVFVFLRDLMDVYGAMEKGQPLPRPLSAYEDRIKKELADADLPARTAAQTKALFDWYRMDCPPTFCTVKGLLPGRPARRGPHSPGPIKPQDYFPLLDRAGFEKYALTPAQSEEIRRFVTERQISAEWVIQLGMRVYLSKINNSVNDTVFWVLCPRRRTVAEKRCGGTLASPMPWREQLPGSLTVLEALHKTASTQAFLFRHTDVPFTALRRSEREIYGYTPLQTANSMMFSYLPLETDSLGGREYEFLGLPMGRYVMPLYTVTLFDAHSGCYKFNYIHRTLIFSREDIRCFHEGAVRAVTACVRSPEKTLKEIMEEL